MLTTDSCGTDARQPIVATTSVDGILTVCTSVGDVGVQLLSPDGTIVFNTQYAATGVFPLTNDGEHLLLKDQGGIVAIPLRSAQPSPVRVATPQIVTFATLAPTHVYWANGVRGAVLFRAEVNGGATEQVGDLGFGDLLQIKHHDGFIYFLAASGTRLYRVPAIGSITLDQIELLRADPLEGAFGQLYEVEGELRWYHGPANASTNFGVRAIRNGAVSDLTDFGCPSLDFIVAQGGIAYSASSDCGASIYTTPLPSGVARGWSPRYPSEELPSYTLFGGMDGKIFGRVPDPLTGERTAIYVWNTLPLDQLMPR